MGMENDLVFTGVFISAEILLNEDLTSIDKLFLALIQNLSGKQGCSVSNKYLGERMKRNPLWVSKAISRLKQSGFIVQKSFDGRERVIQVLSNGGK